MFNLATTVLTGTLGVLSNIIFLGVLTIFLAFDAGKLPAVLASTGPEHARVAESLSTFASGTRTYLAVSAVFGLIVAVIDTIALQLMGVPGAFVWGVLAFITNFIPNIGFIIGLVPPALLALLEGGVWKMIAVIVVYCAINFVIQSVIQPKYQADALNLGVSLTFLSLVFWTFVLGPLGALLALPMTMLVRALFVDADPTVKWVGPLLSLDVPRRRPTTRAGEGRGAGGERLDRVLQVGALADRLEHPDQHPVQVVGALDPAVGQGAREVLRHQEDGAVLPAAETAVGPHQGLERGDVEGVGIHGAVHVEVRRLGQQHRATQQPRCRLAVRRERVDALHLAGVERDPARAADRPRAARRVDPGDEPDTLVRGQTGHQGGPALGEVVEREPRGLVHVEQPEVARPEHADVGVGGARLVVEVP